LLFLGDITYNKGVYDLLLAYNEWKLGHPQVQLIYAGSDREGERFKAEVAQVSGARYLGRVPHGDAFALMRGAEIVALPSRSEGLPRVILEAVALETKVICPPGIPEFEEHLPASVLPTVSPEAILHALDELWYSRESPSYPFYRHKIGKVVDVIALAYEMECRR
jgi:glycosyltransferase involved in cell wall biosynthesis